MNLRAVGAVIAVSGVLFTGCGQPSGSPIDGRPGVVATTDVYASVARAVAGDRVAVHAIVGNASVDPHEYESTPADALAVSRAAVLVANGGGYDDFATTLLAAATTKPALIDVSALSGLAGEPEFNEHVWYRLQTMAALADRLAAELGRVDPPGAAGYAANADSFEAALARLADRVSAIAAAHRGERVLVTEPVPGYLVEAAGLVDATPPALEHAVETGTDLPAAVLDEALRLLGPSAPGGPVRALLVNAQAPGVIAERLEQAAAAGGVPVVTVTETLPAGTTDYLSWMNGQVDRLAAALERR